MRIDAGWPDIGLAAAVAMSSVLFFLVRRRGRVDLFSPTILPAVMIVLTYMVRPVATHLDPLGWTTFPGDFRAERDDCLVMSFAFAALFLMGLGFAVAKPAPEWAHRLAPSLTPVSTKRVVVVSFALMLVSAASSWRLVSNAGLDLAAAAAIFDSETRVAVLANLLGEGLTFTLSSAGPLIFALLFASVLGALMGEWLYVVLITTIFVGNPVGFVRGIGGVLAALVFFGAIFKIAFCLPVFGPGSRMLAMPTPAFRSA